MGKHYDIHNDLVAKTPERLNLYIFVQEIISECGLKLNGNVCNTENKFHISGTSKLGDVSFSFPGKV